ncbi:hypothetical protein V6N13_051126 [Hibiscus sabdariffa]
MPGHFSDWSPWDCGSLATLTHPYFYSDLDPNFFPSPFPPFCYQRNPNPNNFSDPPIGPACGVKLIFSATQSGIWLVLNPFRWRWPTIQNLQPLFDVALNNAIEVSCMEIYGKERQKVHDMLSKLRGSVNLTVEMWSSLENSNHISENKSRLINGQVLDVRSAAHVINSVVQDAMEALRVVIQKIRGSIQYVKSSQSIQGKFQEMAQQTGIDSQKNLVLDFPIRWNSTYVMLETAIQYKDAFSKMKAKFDKYWSKCSLSLAVAAILDPRFKMKLVEYYYSQIYGSTALDRIKEVSDGLKELFNTYTICSTLIDQDSSLPHSSLPGSGNDGRDRLKGFDKFLHETSQSQSAISDLEKYLDEPVFPRNFDFNILNWWRVHTPRYPILSMMARDVLGTPMSTVSREYNQMTPVRLQAIMLYPSMLKQIDLSSTLVSNKLKKKKKTWIS